jgi:hypothetical protein
LACFEMEGSDISKTPTPRASCRRDGCCIRAPINGRNWNRMRFVQMR